MARMTEFSPGPSGRLPVLALVGRPNVGKSALFNRLTGKRKAIVDNTPGVTRDRNYGAAEWEERKFILIDTGGFDSEAESGLERKIQEQSRLAMEEADVILFVFDGKAGLNPLDRDAVLLLRRVNKPVFYAVNKIDTPPKEDRLYEFYTLGVNEIFPVSAEHGLGITALMDRIVAAFPSAAEKVPGEEEVRPRPLFLAVVGRPNVGKSTLVNRLLGYERSVVDSVPGTTRDALDTPFTLGGEPYVLVDTAGIRRKARIVDRLERYSVIRSLGSVERGDLVIHLLDGPEGVTDQDAQILAYALQRGKGLILAVNKWDLVPPERRSPESYGERVFHKLAFVDFAPLVFLSMLTGEGVEDLLKAVQGVALSYQRRIRTAPLNQALREVVQAHGPPLYQGREVKFFYATQTAVCPPTLTVFVSVPEGVSSGYQRYLIHQLRLALGLTGSPIRLILRARRDERRRRKK